MTNALHLAPAQTDEQSVRELIATWHRATATGDLPQRLSLMSRDVDRVVEQQPIDGRERFTTGFGNALQHYRFEADGVIQEIYIAGDWAYCWHHRSATLLSSQSGSPIHRSGNMLTLLRKQVDGAWVVVCDAVACA